jgi:aryl-alcohol dehydrogenase-like predicted oxidoreductase
MEYGLLGKSGCAVSAFALGTLTFGNETDETVSFVQLDRFTAAAPTAIAGLPARPISARPSC